MKIGLITIAVLSTVLFSCSKSNISPVSSFTWTYMNTSYAADTNAAYLHGIADRPIILGWNKSNEFGTYNLSITLTGFNVGTYNLTSTSVSRNNLYYNDDNGNE